MPGGWRRRGTRWSRSSRRSASKAGTSATCSTATAWRRASKSVSLVRGRLEQAARAEGWSVWPRHKVVKATLKPFASRVPRRCPRVFLVCSSCVPRVLLLPRARTLHLAIVAPTSSRPNWTAIIWSLFNYSPILLSLHPAAPVGQTSVALRSRRPRTPPCQPKTTGAFSCHEHDRGEVRLRCRGDRWRQRRFRRGADRRGRGTEDGDPRGRRGRRGPVHPARLHAHQGPPLRR